ncbi:MAG: Nif3-like dinuclear metal center hexameric protein [Clostridiales Family XIII bacterium]|jgi:dinuclear metal center YbgI/SA1388 family protein|nr:Nif3-like dinuclear metal center hexameric protein [Clostridiales Family XIII bacterium]
MAISKSKLIKIIEKIAPPELSEDWDNTGIQIDTGADEIKRVLVALDVTDAVIEEAVRFNADFILCHHPVLFNKIKSVNRKDASGRYVIDLIKAGIVVYAAHLSFDAVYGGNNDYLAALLGLQKVRRMSVKDTPEEKTYARTGYLNGQKRLAEVCELIKVKLGIDHPIPVVGDPNALIEKIGLCTGGGGDMLKDAVENECSLFITGDIRHHEALLAAESGLCLIDAGHYHTERIFAENFAEKLRTSAGDLVEIIESRAMAPVLLYL